MSARPASSSCSSRTSSSAGRSRPGRRTAPATARPTSPPARPRPRRDRDRWPRAAPGPDPHPRRQPGNGRGADPARRRAPRSACRRADGARHRRGPGGHAAERGRDAGPPRPAPPPARPGLRPGRDTPIHPIVRIGRHAAEGIIEASAEQEADLIIFGWGGKAPAGREGGSVISPTIDEVVRDAPADIAVVKQRGSKEIRRIVVPVRGGPHAELARPLRPRDRRADRCHGQRPPLRPARHHPRRPGPGRARPGPVHPPAPEGPRRGHRPRSRQRPERDPARGRPGRPRRHGRVGPARRRRRRRPTCSAPCRRRSPPGPSRRSSS